MTDITNPHDKFFKEALAQPGAALAFLRDYLPPEVVVQLDLTTLTPSKDSFVDAWLQEYFADLVFEVELRDRRAAYVCFLFEHKSYVDPWAPLQVLHYMVLAWRYGMHQYGRLAPVIPIVVYHGVSPWRAPRNFHALFDLPETLLPYVPEFRYLLNDLSTYSDEELKRSAEIGVALLVMKHIFRPDLRARLPEVFRLWYTMQQQEHALGYLEAVLRYVVFAGKEISEDDVRQVLEEVQLESEAIMGTIAQELLEKGERRGLQQGLEQGLEQGLQQGLQQGLEQGLISGIRLALKLKFGLAGVALMPEIVRIENVAVLQAIHDSIDLVETPEELRAFYQRASEH
jgi:predicted transposase/invertase (TIGR01784 family)